MKLVTFRSQLIRLSAASYGAAKQVTELAEKAAKMKKANVPECEFDLEEPLEEVETTITLISEMLTMVAGQIQGLEELL